MTDFSSDRTFQALALLRSIADKIAAGAEFTNTESGRKASEFYQQTREISKAHGVRMTITERQLSYLQGIDKRLKPRKQK